MTSDEMTDRIRAAFPQAISAQNRFRDETSLSIQPGSIREVCEFCKSTLGFNYLIDVSSVDHFGEEPRYEVVYELYSMRDAVHLRLKTTVSEDDARIPSVADLWPTADWHEREAYDMMGITFTGHPDLRRILMWDGYPFHPLRKDFPLQGKPSEMPGVAFTEVAPLAGGPFVTIPTDGTTQVREPRARHAGELPTREQFLAEP
jgi:NADH-quinone oxidoreductase subunit C